MATLSLSLDTTLLRKRSEHSYGISEETVAQTKEKIRAAEKYVSSQIESQAYGFIQTLDNPTILQDIFTVLSSLEWASTLVVIGIGGSDLGARAIQQALSSRESVVRVLFHGDSTDPVATSRLLEEIEIHKSVFVIISKSGETVETIAQYVLLKDLCKRTLSGEDEWQKHFVFITDAQNGILRTEATTHDISTLSIPDTVGGRFSVQTSVGLLPAAALGVDLEAFLSGARDLVHSKEGQECALQLAAAQYQLYTQGTKVVVCMPYSTQLEETARWFRQLWAESLGKQNRGILPIQARGPADQHSQVQFYAEGEPLQSLLFITVAERAEALVLPNTDVAGVEYLAGHSLHEIITAEHHATALSLAKAGRPSATITLQRVDAYGLGQLFLLFELSVVYLASLLEVSAFDQPGVEEGKQMMYALLNREGYEEKRLEIAQLQKQFA